MRKLKCLLPLLINSYNARCLESGAGELLTQLKLAESTGLSPSAINRLYNGRTKQYDSEAIEKLCHFFGCDVGDLLALKEVSSKAESSSKLVH